MKIGAPRSRRAWVALAAVACLALAAGAGAHEGHVFNGLVIGGTSSPLAPQENVEYVTGDTGFTGGHVAREGDRLYLGSYGRGFRIYDVAQPSAPRFLGEYLPGGVVADAPPDAAVFDGRHIAVLNGTSRTSRSIPSTNARTDHTYFLDVTDPAHPRLLWKFDGAARPMDGESHNGDIVDNRRLYLASGLGTLNGVGNGLRIYDLNPLLGEIPAEPRIVYRGDPVQLWKDSPYRNGRDVGPAWIHTHDVEVYTDFEVEGLGKRDIALLAGGGTYTNDAGNTGSIMAIDITDPANPVALLRWLHPAGEGHHPVRYFHEIQFLDADPRVALVTDEDLHNGCDAGGVVALRLSDDLTEATELSEWFIGSGEAPGETPAASCSVHVFSTHGNLAFFGSYNAGLQVVDYSDPAKPRKVGYHLAPGTTAWGALYAGDGIVWVGDMARGLDVFRYTGPQPDLTVADVVASNDALTGVVRNVGGVAASAVRVRFEDDGVVVGETVVERLDAGGEATVSVPWSKGSKGERTITVTADPTDEIDEADEGNNARSRNVTVKRNKVRNGSFSESSSGTAPDAWTASGSTSWDGTQALAGAGGSWVSEPFALEAGRRYELAIRASGAAGTVLVEQLSATGAVLASTPVSVGGAGTLVTTAAAQLTAVAGATQARVVVLGGVLGTTVVDDVSVVDA